jgi:hypothetical protein
VAQLEHAVALLAELDLRHGGGLVYQMAKAILRWAATMLDAPRTLPPVQTRLAATVSALSHRAGWAAFDVAAHEPARSLFRLALHTATRGGDPNLRAHVLADVAAQHNQLGYHHDALAVIRLAEGDERVAGPVRMLLHGVKARVYAALREADHTHRQIDHAEAIYANPAQQADPEPGWVVTLWHPGHLYTATGHAMATLAAHTGAEAHAQDAQRRLTQAIDVLDPATHTRARTLAALRLARLQLVADDPEAGVRTAGDALQAAAGVRSARITQALATLGAIARRHPDQQATQSLASQIDTVIGGGAERADGPGVSH